MKFTGERFIMGQAVGDIVIEHLQRYKTVAELVKGKIVLDAACGEGYGSFILSENAASVVGIDISEQAVAYAQEKYNRDNLTYQCASIEKLPLDDNSVDMVVSFETIEHVDADLQRTFLQEIKRVLKPNGMLIMSSPDKLVYSDIRKFNNVYHVHEMYTDEFKGFLGEYFSHCTLFRQGIDNKRLGVIEPLDGEPLHDIRVMGALQMNPDEMQYIIAICSDDVISAVISDGLVSVMPFVLDSPVRIFVDCGNGFNEEDVLVGDVTKNGDEFIVRFDFVDMNNVMKLRFDPLEKCGCICRIWDLTSNIMGLSIKSDNAFDMLNDGAERFLNDDPQYSIMGDFAGIEFLEIVYHLELISLNELWKLMKDERDREFINKLQVMAEFEVQKIKASAELVAQKASLENLLHEIYNSRGYRLVQKYYGLRDAILPKNSVQRLFIKNVVKGAVNYKKTLSLINSGNVSKVIRDIKRGNARQLMVKIDSKMNSTAVQNFVNQANLVYNNDLLAPLINELWDESIVFDIVVPIYNAFEFAKKCIESVYENTDVCYELYLINDCSTDERISSFLEELATQPQPQNLKKLHIIKNEENLGFIKSVNKGMLLGQNHVVLLNTDTEVPSEWLRRLARPVLDDKKVASVTPFSNCATICSFPNFCEDNELPEGMNIATLDKVFAEYGGNTLIELPTGVGFCMLINRQCLAEFGDFDTVYGKGYGEENDWCMRVYEKGYKNVMITNLFVYHKHGVSFAEHKDKGKEERIQENLELLNERYPEYTRLVADFIGRDVGRRQREFLQWIVFAQSNATREGVLFINHSSGGGTKVYQDKLISDWKADKRLYGIEIQADYKTLTLTDYNNDTEKVFNFDLDALDEGQFKRCIDAFSINLIYINQLVTYPLEKMINCIKAAQVEYVFFVHDFYAVCPTYTLLDNDGVYCNAQKDKDTCNTCLRKSNCTLTYDIAAWQRIFHDFLLGAKAVCAPSENTADIIKKYYKDIDITVKEHEVGSYIYNSFNAQTLDDEYLTIATLGAIGENKGAKIIYELVEKIRAANLPIRIKVIGSTNLQNEYYKSQDGILEITGPYDNTQVSELLARHRVSTVLISSICPETYSYTTSEAIASGYPVIAFNIGAPAERIKQHNCGWIVDEISSDAIMALLEKLVANRGLLRNKVYKMG